MNKSSNSEHIRHLAAGFVVDDLAPEEAEEFQQLLVEHPELLDEVEDLQEVLRQVLDGFTQVEAPQHLLPALLKAAEASTHHQAKESTHQHHVVKRFPLRWNKILMGIAALFVVMIGIDYYRLRQNLGAAIAENQQLQQEFAKAQAVKTLLQEPQTRLFTFKAVNPANQASGSIILNREQQKALMLIRNLPAPPSGQVYVLWTVVASKKLPCGEIKPYAWGNASYELPFTPEMYREFYDPKLSGLVVTLETDPTVSLPTGPTVMQSLQI
jgi:hypothetical protein